METRMGTGTEHTSKYAVPAGDSCGALNPPWRSAGPTTACCLSVPSCAHLFSSVTAEPSAAMAWEKLGMGWQGMGWPRELQTPCVCHRLCHRLCVCLRGAYTMPDSWVSHVWHCCFVPEAVLNSLIYTGLSCYSYYVWDKETGAGGFLLLNFLVLLVIPPAQAKSQGFYSVLTVEAARGLSPISPSQLPQAGASPAEQGAADGDFCVPLPLQKLPALLPSESGQPEARVRCPEYPRGFPAGSHPPPHSSSAAETVPGVKLRSGLLFALLISFLFTSHLRQCLVLL